MDRARVSRVGEGLARVQYRSYVSSVPIQPKDIEIRVTGNALQRQTSLNLFERILQAIVSRLESEREKTRARPKRNPLCTPYSKSLSPDTLLREKSGRTWSNKDQFLKCFHAWKNSQILEPSDQIYRARGLRISVNWRIWVPSPTIGA